jgi:hypothetical protein
MTVKLKHVTGGRAIEVSPDMAPMYESQGWAKVTAPATPRRRRKAAPAPTDTATPDVAAQ